MGIGGLLPSAKKQLLQRRKQTNKQQKAPADQISVPSFTFAKGTFDRAIVDTFTS